MKNFYAAFLAGSLCFTGANIAQANEIFDYAGGGVAIQDVDISGVDSGFALVLNGGKNMPNVHENFYIEGEFSYTLSNPEGEEKATFLPTFDATFTDSIEVTALTLAGYGVFVHPLSDQFNIKARAGLLYENIEVDFDSACSGADCAFFGGASLSGSESDTDFGLSYGFGAEYVLSNEMKISFDYTVIESDVTHLGLGVKIGLQ